MRTTVIHVTITAEDAETGQVYTWTGASARVHEHRIGPDLIPTLDLRMLYPTGKKD